ncbi:MAG: glucuronate isomerase [Verrucomicrobiae bacterium]
MKTFLTEDFLLRSAAARELYHGFAAREPIFDYHCHIPPQQIADNYRFRNLQDIWLAGDHYKWRVMRSNGIDEHFITGGAPDYEKFLAFARTVPFAIRNPLYHWTHLELLRGFGIDDLLDESTAPAIWEKANALLGQPDFRAQRLIERSRVAVICTTDDPADDLDSHQRILDEGVLKTRVYPTFRPDRALQVDQPEAFHVWVEKLSASADTDCSSFAGFLSALEKRHARFHEMGARLSDHGLPACPGEFASESEAARIYDAARCGRTADAGASERFAGFMMLFFGRMDARRGWIKQLHLGAQRGNNTRLLRALGPDTGFDSIGDRPQAAGLARYLDALDAEQALPKTIIYNLNPADNYVMGTMIGNFQDGTVPGKIQFGSGWWFLDQKEGMEWQINALSNLGLLSRFVGMLTDSRSFLSYPRHEYFRRVLCNTIGTDVENRELPGDIEWLGGIVRRICYGNAAEYFGLEPGRLE